MFNKAATKRTALAAAAIGLCMAFTANAAEKPKAPPAKKGSTMNLESIDKVKKRLKPGTYAVIDTSMGRILCELYPEIAPEGVANFTGLADGTKEWLDPKSGKKVKRAFYDGLIFHRVIPGFMIQGGDPLGTGTGGPGYKFKNEVSSKLKFDKAGRLAYANSGPDTNGSQFFITHKNTDWLNGGYTIFGQAIEGQNVVDAIGNVKTGYGDRPVEAVVMNKVTIIKVAGKKSK